ncbi:MAG: hypothetical protein ABWY36_06225 [Leifsonia sp.]
MADIIVRDELEKALKPLLPKSWKIIPVQRNVDSLSSTIVMFKQQSIARLPEAPQGARIVEFTMTIAVPSQDTDRGERLMDDQLVDLLNAIDAIDTIELRWTGAQKVTLFDQYPAYDVTLQVAFTHTKE